MFEQENLAVFQKRLTRVLVIPLLFVLLGALVSILPRVQADDGFSNTSIQGVWGFSASGNIMPAATPAVAMGVFVFDGTGGCFLSDTINIGGITTSRTTTNCTYSVNTDGTGLISVQFAEDPVPTPLSFVIVDNKKEIRFIRTDLGVANGVAHRQ